MAQKYNSMPEHSIEITDNYEEQLHFFTYCFKESKDNSRQPNYNPNNWLEGSYDMRLFWINEEKELGYGIAKDWKNNKIRWYKFGNAEAWNDFNGGFAAQFSRDNS
jgi:hypothetical protein